MGYVNKIPLRSKGWTLPRALRPNSWAPRPLTLSRQSLEGTRPPASPLGTQRVSVRHALAARSNAGPEDWQGTSSGGALPPPGAADPVALPAALQPQRGSRWTQPPHGRFTAEAGEALAEVRGAGS